MLSTFDIFPEIYTNALNKFLPKKIVFQGNPRSLAKDLFYQLPSGVNILEINLFQTRKHKKKRIDKKWQKRYGYTCIVYYE